MTNEEREELKRRIEVMQAFLDGKRIEYKLKRADVWIESNGLCWDWWRTDYRIKREPVLE